MTFMKPSKTMRTKGTKGENGIAMIKLTAVLSTVLILGLAGGTAYIKLIEKARETTAVSYLEMIRRAQDIYQHYNELDIYTSDFSQLEMTGFIPRAKGESTRMYEDYMFTLNTGTPPNSWFVSAKPTNEDKGLKWFYISSNSSGIHYEVGAPASDSSPAL